VHVDIVNSPLLLGQSFVFVDISNTMGANERSSLLPRHHQQSDTDDDDGALRIEQDKRRHGLKASCYSVGWAVLLFCTVLGVGMSTMTRQKRRRDFTSTTPTTTTTSLESEIEPYSALTARQTMDDEHVDRWETWKRLDDSSSVVDSIASQHVHTAGEILNWESLQQAKEASNSALWDTRGEPIQQQSSPEASEEDTGDVASTDQGAGPMADDAEEELRAFLESSGEAVENAYGNTQSFLNSTLVGVHEEPWFDEMSDWFKSTWVTFSTEAHAVWVNFVSKAKDGEEKLWDTTVRNERIWYATTITNMRKLGNKMRSWLEDSNDEERIYQDNMAMSFYQSRLASSYNTTDNTEDDDEEGYEAFFDEWKNSTDEEEAAIQGNFAEWWNSTREKERVWWKHTRKAFHAFSRRAGEKSKLFFSIVKHSVKVGWNKTEEGTSRFWTDANEEARDRLEYSKHEIVAESKAVWNATVETEERVWDAIQTWFTHHSTYVEELSQPNLYLNSTATFAMMMNGYGWFDYSKDYFFIQQGWDAQINQAYCAVASCTAVLNSFRSVVAPPVDTFYKPYHYATQIGILSNSCVNDNVVRYNSSFDGIFHAPGGLSLAQAQKLLQCHLPKNGFDILLRHLDPEKVDLDQFREELEEALRDPNARIIINFDRKGLGQIGGGHFSPLGGYYEAEDRFLVMDVAKYKYPSVWVTAAKLYRSMATIDSCGNSSVPLGQDGLPSLMTDKDYLDKEKYMALLAQLNCQPRYRGYIIVRAKGKPTGSNLVV